LCSCNAQGVGTAQMGDATLRGRGQSFDAPIPLERFVDHGRWVQDRVAPDVDAHLPAAGPD